MELDQRRRYGRRRLLQGSLAMAGLGVLSGCGLLASSVRQPANLPRIGYLASGASEPGERDDAFRQGLVDLGYREGGNLAIEWRFAERPDLLRDFAAELVRLQVAVIVVAGGRRPRRPRMRPA